MSQRIMVRQTVGSIDGIGIVVESISDVSCDPLNMKDVAKLSSIGSTMSGVIEKLKGIPGFIRFEVTSK